ncbi:MAG: hypothetical protein RXR06_10500 [Thermoproteus sp.]
MIKVMAQPRAIYAATAALLIPYLALYAQALARNLAWMPLGDDYPIHVYFALQAREDPLAVVTTPGEYPSLVHLLGLLTGDPLALGRAYAIYGAALIAAGALLYGAYAAQLAGRKAAALAGAAAVVGSVRTLAGIVDGQIADKTVLLVLVPLSLILYAKGRRAAAVAALAPALFLNYLGLAYAAALALAYAAYGGRPARLALAAAAAVEAALAYYKLASAAGLALAAGGAPLAPWNPLWGLISGFYGPSAPLLAAAAAYAAVKRGRAAPLALAALIVLAAALASPQYGERLMRIASVMLPAAAVGGLLEARRDGAAALILAAYLAGPAAAGWAWATGHLNGLFAPVQRLTPDKLHAYQQALKALPPHSNVEVMWQLDLWLVPLAKAQRPDLNVTTVACVWTPDQYYVYTPPDPRQWYMPCTLAAGPPPGREVARWGETALYEGPGRS